MSARVELTAMFAPFLSGTVLEEAVGEAYALILREVADGLESRLVKEPLGEAEEHVNDCYQEDIRRLRRMADEAGGEQP